MISLSNGMDLSSVNNGNKSAPVGEGETIAASVAAFCDDDDFRLLD